MPRARAVLYRGAGGVEVVEVGEIDVRDPGPGEVLVRVAAAGLNRADILQRRGFYPAPPGAPSDVPGLEYAGTVEAVGDGVTSPEVGARVMGIAGGGAMADYLVVHARETVRVPDALSLEEAAAVPEVFFTAYDALFERGRLALGETVVLHAVGSGVGTAALQLARSAGATVIGTSRTAAKLERCRNDGLEHAVLVEGGSFREAIAERTGGRGADVILDTVGAAYLEENIKSLATLGRLVVVGLLGGIRGEAPLGLVLAKRATIVGTVLRSRPIEEKITLARRIEAHVVPRLATGELAPVLDQSVPMTEVAAAHQRMESNESFGKIVLRW